MSGSRKSATTPAASSAAQAPRRLVEPQGELGAARGRVARRQDLGVGHERVDEALRGSRSAGPTSRAAPSIPTSSNIASDARIGASDRIGGVEIRQPSAPGAGSNVSAISKRVAGSLPHQPARRSVEASAACRSWTNSWAIEPGPPLRYL